jgi:DNA-binding CsgD family transcriptional regulator
VESPFDPISWREILAVGIVGEDLTAAGIARVAGLSIASVEAALRVARAEGVLGPAGVDPAESVRLVGELSPAVIAHVHATAARFLMSCGPERLEEAIDHARAAWRMSPDEGLLLAADQAASMMLSVGDYRSARTCLEFVNEVTTADAPQLRAQRLCRLAVALDGLGLVREARQRLATAFQIADFEGDAELAVTAAVDYVLPVDWYAGDRRATAQLQRAEQLAETSEQVVLLRAARAMAEMRIPLPPAAEQQVAWVTRPTVAQPLAEDALARSAGLGGRARLMALLGWRSTHRAPEFLAERRAVSAEAFDLAQTLRLPGRMADAAVMLAVDALEAGDRSGCDRAVTVLRWMAEVDGNPRISWHAHTVAAGVAIVEGDLVTAERHRVTARELGVAVGIPGWFGAELLLFSQELMSRDDPAEIGPCLPDDSDTALLNTLGKLIVGLGHARVGDHSRGEGLLRRGMRQIDRESSWLLCHTRAAELAMSVGAGEVVGEVWAALEPWHAHVAVDSQAWVVDGPVSGWLALLAEFRGDVAACRRYLLEAMPVARRMGDVRSVARLEALSARTGIALGAGAGTEDDLSTRELVVLQRVVDGWSNPQIAESLAFSRSTIRNELSVIYRKLGVSSRLEAAEYAVRMGLCRPPTGEGAWSHPAAPPPPEFSVS